jgi:hypothetical protein
MSTLDSDFGFDAVIRQTMTDAIARLRPQRKPTVDSGGVEPMRRGAGVAITIFAGLGIISLVIFATGYSALMSDTPAVWIHRLMALTVAQSILIAGVAMKLFPHIDRSRFTVRILSETVSSRRSLLEKPVNAQGAARAVPPPLPMPRPPVVGGRLAGREFLEYDDGSIEIDTLVGRRRFVSLDAAKEFVGG